MTPLQSSIIILFHLFLSIMICTDSSHTPLDNIFINCGSSGSSTAFSGQQWIGDVDLKSSSLVSRQSTGRLIKASPIDKLLTTTDHVPYSTAQLSMFDFTYTFQVSPGPKFIRLHFYPASFPGGFQRSGALFTVKAGPYTLLNNFSASSTADDLGLKVFTKEFCITIEEPLRILFSPSNSSSSSYAFVNGIEVVSMPTGLYYTPIGDAGSEVVGQNYRFVVRENTAMELVKRLNVGGSPISHIHDPGLFREWSDDTVHLQGSGFSQITTTARINYKKIPTFIAPQRVYQTSWSVDPSKQVSLNFTWRLMVDSGFRYLIRLHFCELHYEIIDSRERKFSIIINNQMAESKGELIKWGGEIGVELYKDYVVEMEGHKIEGKYDMFVTICSHQNPESNESIDAILKALELFKLSNPDNYNLAGVNPVVFSQHSDHHKSLFIPIGGHDIITIIVVTLLTVLAVIVYAIRVGKKKYVKRMAHCHPQLDVSCRRFSLSELRSATNNFDDQLVIGKGGFGKVYKGSIDVEEKPVAIKRLNPTSGQGATEFLTEIEMLSNFKDTHLVSLIGYCREGHEMILVYENMIRGTLADHLYKINRKGNHGVVPNLSWEQRLNICLGAARGLNYLHTGVEKSIIHRDVKSTNILLDENWVAKIADFGLCKTGTTSQSHTHISTTVKGTIGYLDPDYFLTRRLTMKSDVFAFGVVMLEIICGRPALDTTLEGEERSLDRWAKEYIETGTVEEIIDPSLRGSVPRNCLNIFANLAKECLCNHPSGRPTMAHIITNLQNALARLYEDDDCRTKEAEAEEIQLAYDDQITHNESCSSSSIEQSTVPSTSNLLQIVQNKEQKQSKEKSRGISTKKVFQRASQALSIDLDFIRNNSDEAIFPEIRSHFYRKFTKSEIIEATDNFSSSCSILGSWMFYKGTTSNGTIAAFRRMRFSSSTLRGSVRSEFLAQNNQLQHVNVMPLIGYCIYDDIVVFVHDFMANGSLYLQLKRPNHSLQWKKLLEICIGVAQGLWYLHSRRIIHCKMRPINILLDENWVPKISNFGSSVIIPDRDNSVGYSDPTSKLTEKMDIYAFGVILLGILCSWDTPFMRDSYHYFPIWLNTSIQEKDIDKIINSNLMGRIAPDCLMLFIKVVWVCVHYNETDTFNMDNVLVRLQEALQLQQNWKGDNFRGTYNDVLNLETDYFSS